VLATWAAWRFRTDGLRATWYPWSALVVFSALSVVGNAMHAHPARVGALLLEPWQAAAFASIPPVALLVASHMLVVIATRGTRPPAPPLADGPGADGTDRSRDGQASPAVSDWFVDDLLAPAGAAAPPRPMLAAAAWMEAEPRGATPADGPVAAAASASPGAHAGGPRLRLVPQPAAGVEPAPVPEAFVAWCAERVRDGRRIVNAEAARAFPEVGSVSTVRRRVLELTGPSGALAGQGQARLWLESHVKENQVLAAGRGRV
jgi:hypothetical protein